MANHHNVYSSNSTTTSPHQEIRSLQYCCGIKLDWSAEEQEILEAGIVKYASEENSLSRHTKIAALFQDKNVRDVVMRICWFNKKEKERNKKRKEYHNGSSEKFSLDDKEMVDMENPFELSSLIDDNSGFMEVYKQNQKLFQQIFANLNSSKLVENLPLFSQCCQNFNTLLSNENVPEQMKHLPPLVIEGFSDDQVKEILLSCPNLSHT